MPDLGEQALSKVAEIGISSQLDEVENLDVDIETDPLKAISGTVDSVSIKGEGMVMQQDLRVEEMQLETDNISINPMSVAFGKIELTRPTNADAQVVLNEADINRAFNSDFIRDKMKNQQVTVNGKPLTVDTQKVDFHLPGEGKLAINADLLIHETNETQQVAFTAVPRVAESGQCVTLDQIEYADGQDVSPHMTDALVKTASELLDLRNFELEGMSLKLKTLNVQPGKMTLCATAAIEQFPS